MHITTYTHSQIVPLTHESRCYLSVRRAAGRNRIQYLPYTRRRQSSRTHERLLSLSRECVVVSEESAIKYEEEKEGTFSVVAIVVVVVVVVLIILLDTRDLQGR